MSLRYSNTLETSLVALNQEHVDVLVRDVSPWILYVSAHRFWDTQ